MHSLMMQVYVKGSDKAVEMYENAFDAELMSSYPNSDGTFYAAELDVCGYILTVIESYCANYGKNDDRITGNTMQFCLQFGEEDEDKVKKAFDILKDGAEIIHTLSPCEYSPLMADLIDRFGIRWCIFV